VSGGACVACASVGLPPCFGEYGCAYGRVSLDRPTGKKSPRRPGMPESAKLAAVAGESQKIGEFLDWLNYELGVTFCVLDDHDRFQPARGTGVFTSTESLLARYFGIDLNRVQRERGRLLAYLRQRGNV
jgi:hypothetical protein